LDLTPEEGLRELESWSLSELIETKSGAVLSRLVPAPSAEQQALLAALDLKAPDKLPEAKVIVSRRVKISECRKSRQSQGRRGCFSLLFAWKFRLKGSDMVTGSMCFAGPESLFR
jgi:hypothetical protein